MTPPRSKLRLHLNTPPSLAASAYENLEWINKLVAYIASVIEEKPQIKIIGALMLFLLYDLMTKVSAGICFGHQITARALGKDCVPNGGRWEVGITPVDLTETGKKIFGAEQLVRPSARRPNL